MTEPSDERASAQKTDPQGLTLRAGPRPVTRFNRKALTGLTAVGAAAILGATLVALDPPNFRAERPSAELFSLDRKPTAEGLQSLPRHYGEIPKPPPLGPPLPGDVGPPVTRLERDLGLTPPATPLFRPNPEDDAARAERLRRAQEALQARKSSVFFQISAPQGVPAQPPAGQDASSDAVIGGAGIEGGRLNLDVGDDPNGQGHKLSFFNQLADRLVYNPHLLQDPISPYQVMAGTVIAASLLTGINSDLPGLIVAQITENVYDSVTGRHLVIPQGARLIGRYDSIIAFGQSRALIIWSRIILPDGASIVMENLPATDPAGYAGLEDEVDHHSWRLLAGITLSTLLGVGTELTLGEDENSLIRAIRESVQRDINRAGQGITERNLNIQPTLTIRPGWPLRVIVHKDLILRPYRG